MHQQALVAIGEMQARIAVTSAFAVRWNRTADKEGTAGKPLSAPTGERMRDVAGGVHGVALARL
jgi:hypothetical protein